jgi:hypothetical protein
MAAILSQSLLQIRQAHVETPWGFNTGSLTSNVEIGVLQSLPDHCAENV